MPIDFTTFLQGDELAEYEGLSPEEQDALRVGFDKAVTDTLKPLSVPLGAAERILDLICDSDLMLKCAKLQRRHFLGLLQQGFSPEQAMALTTNFGSVFSQLKKG